jgi:chitodextrinase
MPILRKRTSFVAGVTILALLALPSLASATPGTGPELVQRSGRLVVVHGDRPDGTATRQWTLVQGLSHVPVRTPEDVWVDPGTPVRLEGTMQDGTLVVADSQTAVRETGAAPLLAAAPATAAAPAVHNAAVIRVQWSGTPATTTAAQAGIVMNGTGLPGDSGSLAAYYLEQSYGQLDFHATVFPLDGQAITLPGTPSSACAGGGGGSDAALYTWLAQALAQLPQGFESSYQHVVLALPPVNTCQLTGVSGVAEVGGTHVWINGTFEVRVLAHELGHNLGLAHAGGLTCTSGGSPVPMGDSCSVATHEYDDPFDAMGKSNAGGGVLAVRQMSMEHKLALNLLPAPAVKVVGAPGTYQIAPMETLTGSAQVLRLPKPGGGSYFVEYRRPIGFFDSQPPDITGVLIRTESPQIYTNPAGPNADTALIDMHPATGASGSPWSDAAMGLGEVFSDALRGITVQNLGQDAAGATLQITLPRDAVPPSAPTGLSAVASGTSASLQWTAATDDFAVEGYVVTRDGVKAGTPATTAFADAGLVPGTTVAYAVAAVDAGGNVGPAATVGLAVPDPTPPSAPTRVAARVTRDGKVHVSWAAATDNGKVASYRVLRAGQRIASGDGLAFVDKAARPGSGSTVVYSVAAVDLAGNVGRAGKARPLRAALLRKLAASALKLRRVTVGQRELVRVKGKVSDARAHCRLRIGGGAWHGCKAKASGAFAVNLPPRGTTPVMLSLRDSLGRVKLQTLRVP